MREPQRHVDQEFVMHLRAMAEIYDSQLLTRVADRMCELIEENYDARAQHEHEHVHDSK